MKQTLRYTAWCWRLCRRPLGMWLALGAAAQAVPLLWAASRPANAAYSYDWLQNSAGTPFVFAVFYLGAAVTAQWPVRQAAGRSRAAFTILTFRMPRRCLLAVDGAGRAVGVCTAWREPQGLRDVASLHGLAVEPAAQGRGVGRALVDEAMRLFEGLGETPVYARVPVQSLERGRPQGRVW